MLPALALGLSALLPASVSALQESASQESAAPEGPVWRSIEEATARNLRCNEVLAKGGGIEISVANDAFAVGLDGAHCTCSSRLVAPTVTAV